MEKETTCELRHKAVDEKLNEHKENFDDIFPRLNALETAGAKVEQQVVNVCEKVGSLTTAIWWFVGSLLMGGGGFIIWYIQNLK